MAKFMIQPHGRLNDWVADEKGYFRDAGLDYEINRNDGRANADRSKSLDTDAPLPDVVSDAYESYTSGHGRRRGGLSLDRQPGRQGRGRRDVGRVLQCRRRLRSGGR